MFTQKVIDKFLNLNNVGLIKNASGVGINTEETCKDCFRIYLEIEKDKVVNSKFKAFGNPNFLAICDEVTEFVKDKDIEEISKSIDKGVKDILTELDADSQYSVSFFKTAFENAIKDFNKRQLKQQNKKEEKK